MKEWRLGSFLGVMGVVALLAGACGDNDSPKAGNETDGGEGGDDAIQRARKVQSQVIRVTEKRKILVAEEPRRRDRGQVLPK